MKKLITALTLSTVALSAQAGFDDWDSSGRQVWYAHELNPTTGTFPKERYPLKLNLALSFTGTACWHTLQDDGSTQVHGIYEVSDGGPDIHLIFPGSLANDCPTMIGLAP